MVRIGEEILQQTRLPGERAQAQLQCWHTQFKSGSAIVCARVIVVVGQLASTCQGHLADADLESPVSQGDIDSDVFTSRFQM